MILLLFYVHMYVYVVSRGICRYIRVSLTNMPDLLLLLSGLSVCPALYTLQCTHTYNRGKIIHIDISIIQYTELITKISVFSLLLL